MFLVEESSSSSIPVILGGDNPSFEVLGIAPSSAISNEGSSVGLATELSCNLGKYELKKYKI